MNLTDIDPQFALYLQEPPRISYTHQDDPWLVKKTVSAIEVLLGRNKIEEIYYRLKDSSFDIQTFFSSALKEAKIRVSFDKTKFDSIPKRGPLMFVANHPFGVIDGVVLCDIALKARGDLRIMLHSLLCQDKQLAPYFLPIDFKTTKTAMKTNIRSKQLALKSLSEDVPILIFPSGMVSTADRFGFGAVNDAPWTTFAAKIAREAGATVVPVFFHGRNSRKFHVASHIAEPLRMALLVNEAINKFGNTIQIAIGDPITAEAMESHKTRQQLTHYLYSQVQQLGKI
jgi:putative hemolysin